MGDDHSDMRKTQDFRDMMYEFRGETKEALDRITETLSSLTTNGCNLGQRHDVSLRNIEKQVDDQWTKLNRQIKAPRQKVVALSASSAGIGGAVVFIIDWVLAKLSSIHPPTP